MDKSERKVPSDWDIVRKQTAEISKLAYDIEKSLDQLAPKFQKLNNTIAEAYKDAPKRDAHLNASPLGPAKVLHNFKSHLIIKGLRIQNSYVPENTLSFGKYIDDGCRWLLKFSKGE